MLNNCGHGAGHFWSKGYNVNKRGRVSLGDALSLMVSTRRFFHVFLHINHVKHVTPVAIFEPRGII